jgi:hypothetical protein
MAAKHGDDSYKMNIAVQALTEIKLRAMAA